AHHSITMGIRFYCPQGHKLNVKSFLAGKKGFCPQCNAKVDIPLRSTRPSSKEDKQNAVQSVMVVPVAGPAGHEGPGATHDAPLARPVSAPSQGAPMALPVSPQATASAGPPFTTPVAITAMPGQAATPLVPMTVPTSGLTHSMATPQPIAPAGTTGAPAVPAVVSSPTPQQQGVNPASATAATPDPIAEAPHAVWYVRPSLGGQYGPASGDMLRQWIQQGRVAADSLVWRDGWPNWQPAGSVLPQTGSLTPSAGMADATDVGLPMPLDPLPVSARGGQGRTIPRRRSNLVVTIIVVLLVVIALALAGVLIAMLR
ncbi:MAG: GYF domain-containing protein, partial [Planctomycetes bacterium]|nr:GYF domain-containing protein [Planctomycetota bacterium]